MAYTLFKKAWADCKNEVWNLNKEKTRGLG
jgi:hypothetical protein